MESQHTLAAPIEFSGLGLHTGESVQVRVAPAPPDTGLVFRRVDLDDFEIEAVVQNVARVAYATTLMKQGVLISTVEHLLSSLYIFGVDNALIEIDNLEVPILDGSALEFVEKITRTGLTRRRQVGGICEWKSRWRSETATASLPFTRPTAFRSATRLTSTTP